MATTTPNYGWTVPTSGDLVKDGATAIETLGDAIDASMNTALGTKKAGMVLLSSVAFSGVASVSFPAGTFTATYDNYFITLDATTVNSTELYARLRISGTDASGTNYVRQYSYGSGASAAAQSGTDSGQQLTLNNFAGRKIVNMWVYKPFLAAETASLVNYYNGDASTGQIACRHNLANSYDSLSIITFSGNFSGNYSVFGVNK
jgi:hypothetical protein